MGSGGRAVLLAPPSAGSELADRLGEGPWLELLPGPHDGTVSVARTRLAGMSDHIVLPYTHTFIAWAPSVARQVDVFLRTGRFERGDPPD